MRVRVVRRGWRERLEGVVVESGWGLVDAAVWARKRARSVRRTSGACCSRESARTWLPAAATTTLPTSAPDPTPNATVIDGAAVTTFSLGPNTAPIDVVAA